MERMEKGDLPELLATCWTSAGNVRPGITGDVSPIPLTRRVDAVAEAGYSGIGLEWADLEVAERAGEWMAVKSRIESVGLDRVEVEFLDDWWADGPRRNASDRKRRGLLAAAEAFGAHHIKLGGGRAGDPIDRETLLRELGTLADAAESHGTLLALEPGAGSALGDLPFAVSLLTELDHPSAGLMLDVWHLHRSGFSYSDLPQLVDPGLLVAVELDDGATEPSGSLFDDTFDNRMLCGTGAFDVPAFVSAIREIGFDGPWGVELMSDRLRRQPIERTLAEARDSALACLR